MAEVLSKAGIFTSCSSSGDMNHHRHQNRTGVCDFSIKSAKFSSTTCFPSLKLRFMHETSSGSSSLSSPRFDFYGPSVSLRGHLVIAEFYPRNPKSAAIIAQMSIGIRKVQKWWEKGLQPNMKEVTGAQDLVDSLLNAGDKLVVVDFFSPGCGGCRALHPKICQLAEMNPDVQFLQVNYEEHKSMSYSLNVHVLPFFRFYRGAEGRVCSFSCTNATIKKFKDALSRYGTDRCSVAPVKGLEEKELLALAANKELSFEYTPKTEERVPVAAQATQDEIVMETSRTSSSRVNTQHPLPLPCPLPLASASQKAEQSSKSEAFATYSR